HMYFFYFTYELKWKYLQYMLYFLYELKWKYLQYMLYFLVLSQFVIEMSILFFFFFFFFFFFSFPISPLFFLCFLSLSYFSGLPVFQTLLE
ncbi:hypothetical protein LOTGIDRAFT_139195, partial [Lottia gigantea]